MSVFVVFKLIVMFCDLSLKNCEVKEVIEDFVFFLVFVV